MDGPATPPHDPARQAGLDRLHAFVPDAGTAYADRRNYDVVGHLHVSQLSPYFRHRLVTEPEALIAVVEAHGRDGAGKFVQEVFWRTYSKGWLEMRPGVWMRYRSGLRAAWDRIQTEDLMRREWETACSGQTGIDCFDHWARELVGTGYLHNHARMWFASIWIFTLRLPWELGADFFLRHLLDGDPASNTLGWRWVAGLHTPGKHYVARSENIRRFTGGRFDPQGQLDEDPEPLTGDPNPDPAAAPRGGRPDPDRRTGLLLTEDDLSPEDFLGLFEEPPALCLSSAVGGRSILEPSQQVVAFTNDALRDAAGRVGDRAASVERLDQPKAIADWAKQQDLRQIVVPHPPVGPGGDLLAMLGMELHDSDVSLCPVLRDYDRDAWPHATAGFFRFRDCIPARLDALGV